MTYGDVLAYYLEKLQISQSDLASRIGTGRQTINSIIRGENRVPTFHDLRHTFATVAVRKLDLKTAQSIMGHASADMTMRYADTELSQVQAASNALGGAFSMGN